jgi:hypothetical protein
MKDKVLYPALIALVVITAILLVLLAVVVWAAPQAAVTSCVACHGSADWFEGEDLDLAAHFAEGVHAAAGLGCHDCHGGNPDPALAEDLDAAMDPGYAPNPFRGTPARTAIPELCGTCHSDPAFMRRFNPAARVDQVQEYRSSRHGQRLAEGDTRVATCVDCHGIHGILAPQSAASPVHPRNVAETCRGCHADPETMAPYTLPDGRALPVDQYARWRRSVHAEALFDKEDLSAPTCNDCHGNHGALPPGLESIAFVCGQCHGREAELFRASAKRQGFHDHNEFLASAEGEGCAACHEAPQPNPSLASLRSFTECTTCHGNHGIVRPTVAMLAPLPAAPCTFCHAAEGALPLAAAAEGEPEAVRRHFEEVQEALLAQASDLGLDGDERYDWMVDQALALPFHTTAGAEGEAGPPRPRAEFRRLFDKFRIGKTYYEYEDPVSGEPVRAPLVRCTDCHRAEPDLAPEASGLITAEQQLARMLEVTSLTARAERMLLRARRGGVEVRGPARAIDQAVDAQIEMEVLVHAFSSEDGGAFEEKYAEGRQHAAEALDGAAEAVDELAYRRRGLMVSLGLIALALVGLALKIRQLGA